MIKRVSDEGRQPAAAASASANLAPNARIVDIGPAPLIWKAFSDVTDFFCTSSAKAPNEPELGLRPLNLFNWPHLRRRLSSPDLGLVVVRPNRLPPWSLDSISRSLFNRRTLAGDIATLSGFGPHLLRRPAAPVAVVELDDVPLIMSHNVGLLDRADVYFMRELPSDRWRAFMSTGHRNLPSPRMRRLARWHRRIEKLRPISLGLPGDGDLELMVCGADKTTDVFFAGATSGNSWLRERGIAELNALSNEGIRVDIADGRISREEFYDRLSRAWLAWSPEGLGSDCFRHYEAPMCGSVPVISRSPNERYQPYVEGTHAFYYDVEPGGLARTIKHALARRDELPAMAEAARAHVLAHHTPNAIARYIVSTTLAVASGDQD